MAQNKAAPLRVLPDPVASAIRTLPTVSITPQGLSAALHLGSPRHRCPVGKGRLGPTENNVGSPPACLALGRGRSSTFTAGRS